jgi:neutral ceramidase
MIYLKMGYAKFGQDSSGIHLRLFSRAVIIVDKSGNRICYITADLQGITQIVKLEVSTSF